MGKALYRKYRSKSLSEIVGQEHITTALKNSLKNKTISHAYLFTGPRGVGKTSIARILAHEVNGFEYDESKTYMDIIEIDAASNRRIDEIRDLRDKVHTSPTQGKYKVYIIDEVHMLTKEAFNALLKTLEEPPAHAIFILATTESHKLPDTIISRTQRYSFKPVEVNQAIEHLKTIAEAESFDIHEDAYELIVHHGRGSFRDSISLLDQLSNSQGKVTIDTVRNALGLATDESIDTIITAVFTADISLLSETLEHLRQNSIQPAQTAQQLAIKLRAILIANDPNYSAEGICNLLRKLIDVAPAADQNAMLEVVLFEAALQNNSKSTAPVAPASSPDKKPIKKASPIESKPQKPSAPKEENNTLKPKEIKTAHNDESSATSKKNAKSESPTPSPATIQTQEAPDEVWRNVMADLKKSYNTLYSVVRMAQTTLEDGSVELVVQFPFHQKRLSDNKNKQIIIDLLEKHSGAKYNVVSKTDSQSTKSKAPTAKNDKTTTEKDGISNVTNIFGGGEVLD